MCFQLADLITAMAFTDTGPDITKQPSKLWSSSSELLVTRKNPVEMQSIPFTEVERSIDAILHTQPSPSALAQPPAPVPAPNIYLHPLPSSPLQRTNIP